MKTKLALSFVVAAGLGLTACSNPYDPGQRAVGGWAGAGMGVDDNPRFAPFRRPFREGVCHGVGVGLVVVEVGMAGDEIGLLEAAQRPGRGRPRFECVQES